MAMRRAAEGVSTPLRDANRPPGQQGMTIDVPDVAVHTVDFTLGGAIVAGIVVDEDAGAPVPRAYVSFGGKAGFGSGEAGPDGRFRFDVEPGEGKLRPCPKVSSHRDAADGQRVGRRGRARRDVARPRDRGTGRGRVGPTARRRSGQLPRQRAHDRARWLRDHAARRVLPCEGPAEGSYSRWRAPSWPATACAPASEPGRPTSS